MSKKIVKKRKIKIRNLLLVLVIILGLVFGVYVISQMPIQNILVRNTYYLNDDTILELADVKDYPKFFFINRRKMVKHLEESPYIEKAVVKQKLGFLLEIYIEENRPIFYDESQTHFVLKNGDSVQEDTFNKYFRVPRLLNYVPDNKYSKFIDGMSTIKEDTISKISDIEYQPNDYDKDRFLLYMDDGNMVYLTLTKFKMINHYNEVYKQLENHKGVLYLDNGNHFQIKE